MKFTCAHCNSEKCYEDKGIDYPTNCPTLEEETIEELKEIYKEEENFRISKASALTESHGYMRENRVQETIRFLNLNGYKNIGVAFCIGLKDEANTLSKILQHHGFEVNSVICKSGSIPKKHIDIEDEDQVRPGTEEYMCNPIGQAKFLAEKETEFNLLVGLCVGHDSLFLKYSEAPVSVVVVKDRVLCHNPVGALYQADKYYKNVFFD